MERIDLVVPTSLKLSPPGYASAAITSYADFVKLREEGVVKWDGKFQVSLPTPLNVITAFINPAHMALIYPLYRDLLLAELRSIQAEIPHEDLAVQFDCVAHMMLLERVPYLTPWWKEQNEGDRESFVIHELLDVISEVENDIDVGLHFCYGDLKYKHFKDPEDVGLMVRFGNEVAKCVREKGRELAWIQLPVPKSRFNKAFFEHLGNLDFGKAEVVLGLLHMKDLEGCRKKVNAAGEFLGRFAISAECGFGRASREELDSVVSVAKELMASHGEKRTSMAGVEIQTIL